MEAKSLKKSQHDLTTGSLLGLTERAQSNGTYLCRGLSFGLLISCLILQFSPHVSCFTFHFLPFFPPFPEFYWLISPCLLIKACIFLSVFCLFYYSPSSLVSPVFPALLWFVLYLVFVFCTHLILSGFAPICSFCFCCVYFVFCYFGFTGL